MDIYTVLLVDDEEERGEVVHDALRDVAAVAGEHRALKIAFSLFRHRGTILQ